MKKLALVLLLSTCALAQPTLDSVYVFEELEGILRRGLVLPDGGSIMAGVFEVDSIEQLQVMRLSQEREILWRRGVRSNLYNPVTALIATNDRVLFMGTGVVPIDSISFRTRDLAVCYSLDGDSLWASDYPDGTLGTALNAAISDDAGGYYILGNGVHFDGSGSNSLVRLMRVNADGVLQWSRYFGSGEQCHPMGLVKLQGDTILFAYADEMDTQSIIKFVWTNLSGDSLMQHTYLEIGEQMIGSPSEMYRRNDSWELVWRSSVNWPVYQQRFNLLRMGNQGNFEPVRMVSTPENAVNGLAQVSTGYVTAGYTPFSVPERRAVLSRIHSAGLLYYSTELASNFAQEGYGFVQGDSERLTMIGRAFDSDSISHPCLFYFAPDQEYPFLYSEPREIEFGVVTLQETMTHEVTLHLESDSSVTITNVILPEVIAVSLPFPSVVLPGESLTFVAAFRPDELRQYYDTIHVISDAWNGDMTIPIHGSAPYAECTPAIRQVNFFWINVGDSVRRPLAIFNTGNISLHIEALVEPVPFYLDSVGPFVVGPDSTALLWFTFRPDSGIDYQDTLLFFSDDPQGADTVILTGRGVGGPVNVEDRAALPTEFKLYPAYPNPFNATAQIGFDLAKSGWVTLELFDVTGRRVASLVDEMRAAGSYRVSVDASGWASGIYFAALRAGGDYAVQKMVLLK